MNNIIRLCEIAIGESAEVWELKNEAAMRRRLCDLGLIEGTTLQCVGISPTGDPHAYLIRGAVIAIRNRDAGAVLVSPLAEKGALAWD